MYNYNLDAYSGTALAVIISIVIIACLIGLTIMILYLLTLQRTLNEVSPHNQKMSPGQVWLMLIPLFNFVWQFIMVNRIADSLKAEFQERNIPLEEERPAYSIGLTYCILNCCGIIPVLGGLASLAGLICWIIYWVKISGYKTKLIQAKLMQPNPMQPNM